jgi:hypothetical protein
MPLKGRKLGVKKGQISTFVYLKMVDESGKPLT